MLLANAHSLLVELNAQLQFPYYPYSLNYTGQNLVQESIKTKPVDGIYQHDTLTLKVR